MDVGPLTGQMVDLLIEEADREVVGLGGDVLRQTDEGRAAVGRVEHRLHRVGQRRHHLLGLHDAIPVPADRTERIVDRRRRLTEVLDLLQHRIRQTAGEGVTRNQQQRDAVGVRHSSGGDHVRCARADRRGRHHDLATTHRLRVGGGGERHALLVLSPPGRQFVLMLLERVTQAGDVAVTEDREHPREERGDAAVGHHGLLSDEVPDDGVGRCESDRLHDLS